MAWQTIVRPLGMGWIDQLPLALPNIRTSFKQDPESMAAELICGTTLSLPADLMTPPQGSDIPEQDLQHLLLASPYLAFHVYKLICEYTCKELPILATIYFHSDMYEKNRWSSWSPFVGL